MHEENLEITVSNSVQQDAGGLLLGHLFLSYHGLIGEEDVNIAEELECNDESTCR
jgi:hypothetical protein